MLKEEQGAIVPAVPSALVIEDHDHIAEIIEFILIREKFRPQIARDGQAAVAMIDGIATPGLVLLDLMLPHVDGFALLARIRARQGWKKVPVIVISAKAQEQDIVRALEAGADDYLVKPFQPNELKARIRRLQQRES